MINFDRYRALMDQEDWTAVHSLLDDARKNAITPDDISEEVYLRVSTLKSQERYGEALDHLQNRGHLYTSQSLAKHDMCRVLVKLSRERDALEIMSGSPYEAEMSSFPILALDAKFFHVALLAKVGDPLAKDRLREIPDDYFTVTMDGDLLSKSDVIASLGER